MADQLQDIVQRMVAGGESEDNIALVIKSYKPTDTPQNTPDSAPKADPMQRLRDLVQGDPASAHWQRVKDNPAGAGASIATMAAAPFVGGLGAIGRIAAMGGAGAAGAVPGALIKGDPSAILREGAIAGGTQGIGGAVGGILKGAGKLAYRTALSPTQQVLSKYPKVVTEGLTTRTPVSVKGLEKASATKATRLLNKQNALIQADDVVGYRVPEIVARTQDAVNPTAAAARRAGLPDPAPAFAKRGQQVLGSNPPGWKPSEAEEVKRTLDDQLGGAFRKVAKREPVSARERFSMQMSKEIGNAQADSIPGYRDMNRSIMDASGLESAIKRRTSGSGGNQVLDTLLMATMGPTAIPGRVAMMPSVLSRIGIGSNVTGGGLKNASPYLAALVSRLMSGSPNTPQDQ